jgi:inhibitor of KinA sporulation pathway (predicted exonuclease)
MIERNQKFLALDLELNQPSGKIIQVGVAIGSAQDRREQYVTRKWYINPNEPLDDFIIGLTGITATDISTYCVSHYTVAQELSEVIKEHKCFVNPVTWGGGDSTELLTEFCKNHADFPHFGRRWIDVKTWYTLLMLAKNKNPSGGLASAMGAFKLQFIGDAHRADVDAANTLAFFFKLLERQRSMENLLDTAKAI